MCIHQPIASQPARKKKPQRSDRWAPNIENRNIVSHPPPPQNHPHHPYPQYPHRHRLRRRRPRHRPLHPHSLKKIVALRNRQRHRVRPRIKPARIRHTKRLRRKLLPPIVRLIRPHLVPIQHQRPLIIHRPLPRETDGVQIHPRQIKHLRIHPRPVVVRARIPRNPRRPRIIRRPPSPPIRTRRRHHLRRPAIDHPMRIRRPTRRLHIPRPIKPRRQIQSHPRAAPAPAIATTPPRTAQRSIKPFIPFSFIKVVQKFPTSPAHSRPSRTLHISFIQQNAPTYPQPPPCQTHS